MYYRFTQPFRSAYDRITLNKVTTAFFIFSFVHCFAQGIIQSLIFSIDAEYSTILSSITTVANIPPKNITYVEGSPGHLHLRMCNDIPFGSRANLNCTDIFQSDLNDDVDNFSLQRSLGELTSSPGSVNVSPNATGVTLMFGSTPRFLNHQCTQILVYPKQIMRNSKREDLTFVLLQFWLFAISVIAIMYDSVPHTLAVLITRFLITIWSAIAIWRTKFVVEGRFMELIFRAGTPCAIDLFPTYFRLRLSYEIPDLILNVTALLIACYLSFTLLRDYSAKSFKCVGAPEHINRIHKFFMAVLACLQLEAFMLVTAMGLWVDVLINTAILEISTHTVIYEGLFILTTILFIPWITLGWFAIQREMRKMMLLFLGIGFFFLSGWSIMFYSKVYRWSFIQWPLLGVFTVASLVLIVASIVLGVICRLNFGHGLAEYLHAEAALASSNFAPEVFLHDEEKSGAKVPMTFDAPMGTISYTGGKDEEAYSLEQAQVVYTPAQATGYKVPYNVPF